MPESEICRRKIMSCALFVTIGTIPLQHMFNKYWREYPWWMQIMQFGLMVFIFLGFAWTIGYLLLPVLTGTQMTQVADVSENSPKNIINGVVLFQFISSSLFFLLPSLLFAYTTHPKPFEYLGLRKPGKPVQWILASLVILGLMPMSMALANWLSQFNLGAAATQMQSDNDRLTKALLKMSSPANFMATFITIAIIPAIGEELFFRGVLMKFSAKRTRGMVTPLVISAILFAFMHSNVYGMPAIFFDGIVLGLIYYWTGSLWCSILAHFINNGLQVILMYASKNNATLQAMNESNDLPWYLPVIGAVVFASSLYLLWKNRTPLPSDWTDDFAGEERIAEEEEQTGDY